MKKDEPEVLKEHCWCKSEFILWGHGRCQK